MAYCIMNVDKQCRAAVYGLQIEANRQPDDGREFDRSDIDKSLTKDNVFLIKTDNWNSEITQQIHEAGLKERKDSVVMITGVYTASPEWFKNKSRDEIIAYFKDCLDFHNRTYGQCFNAVIHFDETTPHMQVASVPIIHDEKGAHLSAKIVMGNRNDYRLRQDQFYDQVGLKYNLDRGERRDPADRKAHRTKEEWQTEKLRHEVEQLHHERRSIQKNISDLSGSVDDLEDLIHSLEDKIIELDVRKDSRSSDLEDITTKRDDLRAEYDDMVKLYNSMLRDIQEFKRQRKEISEIRDAAALAAKEKISTDKIIQRIRRDLPKIGKTPEEQKYISEMLECCISQGIESQQQSHEKKYRDAQHFFDDGVTI